MGSLHLQAAEGLLDLVTATFLGRHWGTQGPAAALRCCRDRMKRSSNRRQSQAAPKDGPTPSTNSRCMRYTPQHNITQRNICTGLQQQQLQHLLMNLLLCLLLLLHAQQPTQTDHTTHLRRLCYRDVCTGHFICTKGAAQATAAAAAAGAGTTRAAAAAIRLGATYLYAATHAASP